MAQYIGFSTVNSCKPRTTNDPTGNNGGIVRPLIPGKKYQLNDGDLVIQDFINALNIRKGSKVGKPQYGSDIWDYIFESNTADTQFKIENEIRRVAGLDPRLIVNAIKAYPFDNGILVEIQVAVNPFNQAQAIKVGFSQGTNIATLV